MLTRQNAMQIQPIHNGVCIALQRRIAHYIESIVIEQTLPVNDDTKYISSIWFLVYRYPMCPFAFIGIPT